jgi:hypothetical protein
MGIQDVVGYLQINVVTDLPRLFVCGKNCPMTEWQMKHYGLKPPTAADQYRYDPQPVKVKDDFCDCVRGTVVFGPPAHIAYKRRPLVEEDAFGLQSYQ